MQLKVGQVAEFQFIVTAWFHRSDCHMEELLRTRGSGVSDRLDSERSLLEKLGGVSGIGVASG